MVGGGLSGNSEPLADDRQQVVRMVINGFNYEIANRLGPFVQSFRHDRIVKWFVMVVKWL